MSANPGRCPAGHFYCAGNKPNCRPRGATAAPTASTARAVAPADATTATSAYDEAYALYLGQTALHDSAITPDGGMVMKGPNGWNTFDQDDNYLGTFPSEDAAYAAIRQAHGAANTFPKDPPAAMPLGSVPPVGRVVPPSVDRPAPPAPEPSGEPALHQDVTSRVHPVYGGNGWGVSGPDIDGDYTINHGHLGVSEIRDGKRYVDYSGTPLADHEVCWSAHSSDRADARYVWENRDAITAELHRQGLGPLDANATRLTVNVSPMGDRIRVEPFSRHDKFEPFDVSINLDPYE